MKLYATDDRTINFIQFKNIKIALDMDVYIFFEFRTFMLKFLKILNQF